MSLVSGTFQAREPGRVHVREDTASHVVVVARGSTLGQARRSAMTVEGVDHHEATVVSRSVQADPNGEEKHLLVVRFPTVGPRVGTGGKRDRFGR